MASNAPRDQNRIPALLGTSKTDGITPVEIYADDTTNSLYTFDKVANSLVPDVYDYISLSYTGSNLTGVVFKTGGSGGTTVSTLTLAYDGSDNLTSVTKS